MKYYQPVLMIYDLSKNLENILFYRHLLKIAYIKKSHGIFLYTNLCIILCIFSKNPNLYLHLYIQLECVTFFKFHKVLIPRNTTLEISKNRFLQYSTTLEKYYCISLYTNMSIHFIYTFFSNMQNLLYTCTLRVNTTLVASKNRIFFCFLKYFITGLALDRLPYRGHIFPDRRPTKISARGTPI